jgi:hypothetical protein
MEDVRGTMEDVKDTMEDVRSTMEDVRRSYFVQIFFFNLITFSILHHPSYL